MSKPIKIYTRTGDDGSTGLVGGQRLRKDALRIEAYGTVDELCSVIGLARTALAQGTQSPNVAAKLDAWLAWTQDVLFNLGSELATPFEDRHAGLPRLPAVTQADAAALERAIDAAQAELPPLSNFIHPGGSYPGAFLHQARTVCRRAERLIVRLNTNEPVSGDALRYMNRLSDALFTWSRWINHALAQPEHLWNGQAQAPET
jgi:cob(I)alamin adenosyltransferase